MNQLQISPRIVAIGVMCWLGLALPALAQTATDQCEETVFTAAGLPITSEQSWCPEDVFSKDFATMEYALFGAETSVQWQSLMGSGAGMNDQDAVSYPSSDKTSRKVKSGLLSLVLPGAGQFYNGDRSKAYVFAGVEAAIWVSYLAFDTQGDNRTDTYTEYAGIYAGVQGEHVERYWQAVGRYMDSDAYNEAIRREARALSETATGLIPSEDAWQWSNSDHLATYQELRANANRSYDRRDFMILFAILNRAISVYDAVRHSVDDKLSGEVLGFKVDLDVSPSLHRPRAQCAFKRSF